jgi:drug/metabolite transporter (DMT)-like permease
VLNATTPVFAALLAAGWLGQRVTARTAAGLATGVVGVVLVVGWSPLDLSRAVLLSAGASLLAALLYAAGGLYSARAFAGVPGLTVAAGQQLAGAALLLPLLAAAPPGGPVTADVALAVLALAVVSTALGFVLFFRLVAQLGPTSALTTTYLVPVFGVLWGALFLGEPVGWSLVAGLAVVLTSVGLIAGVPRLRLARERAPSPAAPPRRRRRRPSAWRTAGRWPWSGPGRR